MLFSLLLKVSSGTKWLNFPLPFLLSSLFLFFSFFLSFAHLHVFFLYRPLLIDRKKERKKDRKKERKKWRVKENPPVIEERKKERK